jgi:nicotinamidase-related amidase
MRRLTKDNAILAVIDVQEKLAAVIHEQDVLLKNVERLIRGCRVLGLPAVVTEQYSKGIGPTTTTLRQALDETFGYEPIEKMCFSSFGCGPFAETIARSGRKQVILCGIEAHVCVYQTSLDLLDAGYEVYLVGDAVSSRTARNRDLAIQRLVAEGARLTTTEMALFEMTVESGTDMFRAISRLVK